MVVFSVGQGEIAHQLRRVGFREQILCNPPFLSAASCKGRTTDEGTSALVGGETGLEIYPAICQSIRRSKPPLLADGGILIVQLPGGARAARQVSQLCQQEGFLVKETRSDDRGIARCMLLCMDCQTSGKF
ncbi:hypothetical protein CYMTET_4383 [Cymbomonas tetramitiformis]|uniref:Uncharacterized protein n=1 Tax=Cymbomonas tetramitiformis TaxID=36881 RepID=A0AAE0H1H7_9CHLO|nr:hypothetical protein CYMTET_4383 [Cymbomonas tetramitiformis]